MHLLLKAKELGLKIGNQKITEKSFMDLLLSGKELNIQET